MKSRRGIERALPSHMANCPRPLCRATAYCPVTFDCAMPAEPELPSTSAMKMVSEGRVMPTSLVLPIGGGPARVDLLMQSRPFMPYMKKAFPTDGVKPGFEAAGQEKIV